MRCNLRVVLIWISLMIKDVGFLFFFFFFFFFFLGAFQPFSIFQLRILCLVLTPPPFFLTRVVWLSEIQLLATVFWGEFN
jgi:hypothetical protein